MALIDEEKRKQQGFNRSFNAMTDSPANVSAARQSNPITTPGIVGGIASGAEQLGFKNTAAAIRGSAEDTQSAYQKGGLAQGIGMAARTAITPVMGIADDVMTGAKTAIDPAANALRTFATGSVTGANSAPAQSAAGMSPRNPSATASGGFSPSSNYGNEGRVSRDAINPTPSLGMRQWNPVGGKPYDVAQTSQQGVSRITGNGISSPLYTNLNDANQAVDGLRRQTIGSYAAAGFDPTKAAQYSNPPAGPGIGFSPNEGIARMAAANSTRQSMIDAQPRGGFSVLGGLDAMGRTRQEQENDAKSARWRQDALISEAKYRPQISGIAGEAIRGDNQQAVEAMRQPGIAAGMNNQRRGQDLGFAAQMRQQSIAERGQDLNAATGIAKLGIDQGRFGLEQSTMQRQQSAQDNLARAMESGDPVAINRARTLAAAAGVRLDQADSTLEKARIGMLPDLMKTYTEQRPTMPDGKTPVPFDQWARPVMQMSGGGAAQSRSAPQIQPGHTQGGYRFNGGDPANKANWSKV